MSNQPIGLEIVETFAQGLDHSEGICVTPKGELYVGGEAGQLYHIVDDKPVEVANCSGGFLLGLAADAEGRVYAIDNSAKCVWRFDPATKALSVYAKGTPEVPFRVPNWGAFDAQGNYYLTDSGDWMANNGCLILVRPGGRPEIWSRASTAFPNGCCLSADGTRLYVAESVPAAISEIEIKPDGSAGARRVLVDLGIDVPDGIAVTTDGGIAIACYRPDVVYHWHPETGLRTLASDPRGTVLAAPTNIAFMGKELDTLVFPNLGRWHLARGKFGLRGVPLFYPTAAQLGS
jgi:gluconolactonase